MWNKFAYIRQIGILVVILLLCNACIIVDVIDLYAMLSCDMS